MRHVFEKKEGIFNVINVLAGMPRAIEDPILAYTAAEGEINQIQWGATQPDWIAICYNKCLEILRV